MDDRAFDHMYHRSRIDAHINGLICLVTIMAILALTIGDRFKPFQHGAQMLEPVRLIWVEQEQGWIAEGRLVEFNNYPPAGNNGPVQVKEIYSITVSIVLVLGTFAIAMFIYYAARRQTRLMNAIYRGESARAYQRGWEDIRVTFWALNITLAFIVFFLMT